MTERELKKRILESHVYERYITPLGNKRLGILENELDDILDEVAREFQKMREGYQTKPGDEYQLEYEQWFDKWFGEKK